MRHELRDYQQRGLAEVLDAYRRGARSVLMVLPTGGGKTSVFSHLIASIPQEAVILVHRRELATQAANRLREFGVDFGYVMAGEAPKPYARVQVASVQTLVRRAVMPKAALVVADEAHLSTATTWQTILEQYPNARILGATATPWRLSGKPLVGAYDACVVVSSPAQLREAGHLSPYVGFSYLAPDLSKVATVGGEYNEGQSAAAMREPTIVTNIVEQWQRHASQLSTVVFAVTVEHSQALAAQFKAAGVRAEHLDGSTPLEQRKAILARVESGATQVLCNVGVAVEGLDIPRLKCCVLARPTKSLARAIQMMGRVRRPWQGQTARIHDHAFVIAQHGLPDQERDYTLSAKPEALPSLTTCTECLALYSGRVCPACSHENEGQPHGDRELNTIDDAEQFEFSSDEGTVPAAPAVWLPPVDIKWERPGRAVEGEYMGTETVKGQFGPQRVHGVRGEKRVYRLFGAAQLDRLMGRVQVGDVVRATFTGMRELPGGKHRKEFTLEVDDGR
jgi:superfamily II DNA or RNA helicase